MAQNVIEERLLGRGAAGAFNRPSHLLEIRLKGILVDYVSLSIKSESCRCANIMYVEFAAAAAHLFPTIQTPRFSLLLLQRTYAQV
jgi:hypothetical protein